MKNKETCPAVTVMRVIAVIEILASFIVMFMFRDGLIFGLYGIVIGFLLYAFGEVIRLLFGIKINLDEIKNK